MIPFVIFVFLVVKLYIVLSANILSYHIWRLQWYFWCFYWRPYAIANYVVYNQQAHGTIRWSYL